jgi:glycosyltransferase involved in cell wall biosynthesis
LTWHEVWGGRNSYWYKYLGKIGFVGNLVENTVLKLPKLIIAVSNKTVADLRDAGVRKNIVMIPNGVDLKHIAKVKPSKKKFDALFVGRLIADKNADFLLRALQLTKNRLPNVCCGVVGMGPEAERLAALTKKLGLERNVTFLGFLENDTDVYMLMKSAKVLAFPSTREGFGIVAIEANACGLPVITVKHEMNAAVDLVDGKNGSVVDFSEQAFAGEMLRILKKPALRRKMSVYAKKSAKEYDWDKIADNIEDVYRRCLG